MQMTICFFVGLMGCLDQEISTNSLIQKDVKLVTLLDDCTLCSIDLYYNAIKTGRIKKKSLWRFAGLCYDHRPCSF